MSIDPAPSNRLTVPQSRAPLSSPTFQESGPVFTSMLDNTLESASDGGKAFEVVNSLSKGSERLVGLTKGGQLPSDLLQSSAKFQHNGEMKTLAELYEVINGANSQISSASKNDAVIIVFNEIFDLGDSVGGVTKN